MSPALVRCLTPRAGRGAMWATLAIAAVLCPERSLHGQARSPTRPPTTVRQDGVPGPRIPHTRFTLANGLTVVVHEDHSAPVAAVTVCYRVGSTHEPPGRTGFAHLFEHLMFTGSRHAPGDSFSRLLTPLGDGFNGQTTEDHTRYETLVPNHGVETLLWLESDRMGFLLDDVDQADLDRQRDVVRNERRQHHDNRVFGTRDEVVLRALYPHGHPYAWPVIGSMADLSAATLADVRVFFRQHYAPSNATLVIAGDVDTAEIRRLVARYFGDLPRGRPVAVRAAPPATLSGERRLVLTDGRAPLPELTLTWPTVGAGHPDRAALDVVAGMLAGDRTSRLRRLLVHDRQLATTVRVTHEPRGSAGTFTITVVPRAGVSLTAVERLVDSTLTALGALGTALPSVAEVRRHTAWDEVSFSTNLQSVFVRAFWLADGQVLHGNPEHFRATLAAWRAVGPADVRRVARRYLGAGRVVLSMVPTGRLDLVSKPELPYRDVTSSTAAPLER